MFLGWLSVARLLVRLVSGIMIAVGGRLLGVFDFVFWMGGW